MPDYLDRIKTAIIDGKHGDIEGFIEAALQDGADPGVLIDEAMITAMFYILPNIFLAGFFFPIAAMPEILQLISYLFPLRYFLIIVRGIVLKGVGLEAIWPEVIALVVFGLIVVVAASSRFRKSLD